MTKAQGLFNTPFYIGLGIAISRAMPRWLVYGISRQMARYLSRRGSKLYKTLCANYAQLMGPDIPDETLAQMAQHAIYHAGCTYVDMFRGSMQDLRLGKIAVRIDEDDWERAREALTDARGTILVGPHVSNFDLAAQWIAAQGIDMKALSLAGPSPGNKMLNALRKRRGIDMRPVGVDTLRWAGRLLKAGGVVLTGVDRPLSEMDPPISFFGAEARLPNGHVRLALQTDSRVIVAACTQDEDGVYAIHFSAPMEMERVGARKASIAHNTGRVLREIEKMIRIKPDQWLMFVPVWPEAQTLHPGSAEL